MPSGLHSDEKGGPLQRGFLAKLQYTDPKTLDQAMRHGMGVFRSPPPPPRVEKQGFRASFHLIMQFYKPINNHKDKEGFSSRPITNSLIHRLCHKD